MSRINVLFAVLAAGLAGYILGAGRFEVPASAASRDQGSALVANDRAFDQATSTNGVEGWMSFMADDAILMPAGKDMVIGADAIRKNMTQSFTTPGYALRWEPMEGASSGMLGYTYGIYKSTMPRAGGGPPAVSYGKYLTLWKKQGGDWKVAVDIGNSSPAPAK